MVPSRGDGAGAEADNAETQALPALDRMPETGDRDEYDPSDWQLAIADIQAGLARHELVLYLAWDTIRESHQRTFFGPLWAMASVAVFVLGIGLLFGEILHLRVVAFLPYLATGYLVWLMIMNMINEACSVFVRQKNLILSSDTPYSVYVFQNIVKSLITFLLGLPIVVGTLMWYGPPSIPMVLVAVVGLVIIAVNGVSVCILLGIVCLRYRDVRETVRTLMRFFFFLTPIIWQADMLSNRAYIAMYNPFTHFLSLVRDPLLGTFPPLISWAVCLLITAAGLAAALTAFAKLRHRIPFWL